MKKKWNYGDTCIFVCKNDFIIGVISMLLNRFVHAAVSIGFRWYVVTTNAAEKEEKNP